MSRNRIELLELIHEVCEQFETLLKQKQEAKIEDWIQLVDEKDQPDLFFELLRLETHHNSIARSSCNIGEYFRKYPDFSNEIVKVFGSNRLDESHDAERGQAPAKSATHTVPAGSFVGRYRVIGPLGSGGFSTVYLAHDPNSNRAVALKVLRTDEGFNANRNIESVVNEANALSRMTHPAIPKVYDAGNDEHGIHWIAMEFIKGDSLAQMLTTEQLSLVAVLRLLVKIANAVHEIHRSGFAHRDIKPDNIIIGLDGEPRIVDYGLALHEDLQREKSGERAGTTSYMSPEQIHGHSEKLDGRTDIWSLGVILYLVVAKRLPFQGDNKQDIQENILGQPVRPPRQINGNVATIELENICFRSLKKNPEERFSTAQDFAAALESAIDVLPEEILLEEASRHRKLTKNEQCSIQLARQAKVWNADSRIRKLPNLFRYVSFRCNTHRSRWSESESKMMSAATSHFYRLGLLLCLLIVVFLFAQAQATKFRNEVALREMVATLRKTPIEEIESKFDELSKFSPIKSYAKVESAFEEANSNPQLFEDKVRYAIILSRTNPEMRDTLKEKLIDALPNEIETLRRLTLDVEAPANVLDDHWRRRLSKSIVASPLVDGIEDIWPTAPESLVDPIRASGGDLSARFAWCPRMPLAKFKQISDELRDFYYRPVCLRPWISGKGKQVVAAIWHRDAVDWKITYGLSPSDFLEMKLDEPMHLIDVSDGLRPSRDVFFASTVGARQPAFRNRTTTSATSHHSQLVAVWASQKDPFGKARHQLLAQRIPAIADPNWNLQNDSKYAIISEDINSKYLFNSPLLVDVRIDSNKPFSPLETRELQKIRVGQLIVNSCLPTGEVETPEKISQCESGERMLANAYYALGNYDRSTSHLPVDPKSATWEDLRIRTLSYAKSNDEKNANHSMALLGQAMESATAEKTRPILTPSIGSAIGTAVRYEIDFWISKDVATLLRKVKRRTNKIQKRSAKKKYLAWAEYFSLALATNSVSQCTQISGTERTELVELTKLLVKNSLRAKPSLNRYYIQELSLRELMESNQVGTHLMEDKHSVQTSSWTAFAAEYQSKYWPPSSNVAHLKSCQRIGEGYFPISLVMGKRLNGDRQFGSIWHRKIPTQDLARRVQKVANALCFALKHDQDLGVWDILASPRSTTLKRRVIDTFHRFRIDIALLLTRLDCSSDPNERISILEILRNYSNCEMNEDDEDCILDALDVLNQNSKSKSELNLAKIIKKNIDSN